MVKSKPTIKEIANVCSDCGNCLFVCPVYNEELIEPNSPRGKVNIIKSLIEGKLEPNKLNKKFIYQCMVCGSCEHTCTRNVEYVDMMIHYRNLISEGKKIPLLKKAILFFYQSFLFRKLIWVVDLLAKTPLTQYLLIPRRRKSRLSTTIFRKYENQTEYDILLFPGCVFLHFYPELLEKIKLFLERQGFSVRVPHKTVCCGFPYISQGWNNKFLKLREKNQEIFSKARYKYLVVPCGTGAMTFKKYYDLNKKNIFELTEFIYKFARDSKIDPQIKEQIKGKVTFHDPCHTLKSLRIEKEPRFFMEQLGEKFVDDKSALCCGFGGVFSVGFPNTSKKVFLRKKKSLKEVGANTVVTSCPGCYLQLRENLPSSLDVRFFIELFESTGDSSQKPPI